MLTKISTAEVDSMREMGRSLTDRGFFELELVSSKISWANDFVLAQIGLTLEQIQSMTIYDVIPEEFHENVSNFIFDASHGKTSKFYIWPFRSTNNHIAWWYFVESKSKHPLHWFRAEFLNQTPTKGPEYSSMFAAMNTANSYNELHNKFSEFQEATQFSVNSLNEKYKNLQSETRALQKQVAGATAAANRAANAAIDVTSTMQKFKADVDAQFSNQTTEILRLISTDAVHDQRIETFEAHIKKTTDQAVQVITVSANKAGQLLNNQVDKAGQNLSKRVTFPVAGIMAIMAVIQYVISHFVK